MNKPDSSQKLPHSNSEVTSDPMDIWSSILNQKNKGEASQLKTPYIHPLDKKSKSFLSEKSLEMCTESLGSETGSDCFSSSYTPSSSSEDNNPKHKNIYSLKNKKKARCIPPPLLSLTSQTQQLRMKSHRDNGRLFLFLQAVVSVPSHNNFIATRQNGRLILTFADNDVKEEIAEEDVSVIKQPNARCLELVVNQKMKSPKWSKKLVTNFKDVKLVQHGSLPRSLPWINAYRYYWEAKAIREILIKKVVTATRLLSLET